MSTTPIVSKLTLHFLGTGSGSSITLGSAAAVLESAGKPLLMIDCGPSAPAQFQAGYAGTAIPAIYITHAHFDHIGGLFCVTQPLSDILPNRSGLTHSPWVGEAPMVRHSQFLRKGK